MLSPVKIGHHIRQLREAREYSQGYMADMLDIAQSSYASIESGKVALRIDRLYAIAAILNVPPLRLLDESYENPVVPTPAITTLTLQGYEELIQELRSEIAFLRHIVALQEMRK